MPVQLGLRPNYTRAVWAYPHKLIASTKHEGDVAIMSPLKVTERHLPHWSVEGATYYITFCLKSGSLSDQDLEIVLTQVKSGHGKFYELTAVCVMPDHVHLILCPRQSRSVSEITRGIKGVSSRKINQARGTRGALWQEESWDRILRSEEELYEKLNYMLMNPMKANLASDPWSYKGWHLQRTEG